MKHVLISLMIVTPLLAGCGAASSEPAAVVENTTEPAAAVVENTAEPAATAIPPTETSEPATAAEEAPTAASEPDPTAPPEPEPETDPPTPTPPPTTPAEPAGVVGGNPDLDYAQVVYVTATQSNDGTWRFDTTVRHNDQGWDDYADAWQVVNPETGQVFGERILLHPHDNEQPFTRSQSGIVIPAEVTQVVVRAKDNVEGFGGEVVLVDLTVDQGEKFEVSRVGD